jgi:hypothetical protein
VLGMRRVKRRSKRFEGSCVHNAKIMSIQEIGGPVSIGSGKSGGVFPRTDGIGAERVLVLHSSISISVCAAGTVGLVDLAKKERGLP